MKAVVNIPAPETAEVQRLQACFEKAQTFLAASTHAGEEELILDAFVAAKTSRPALRLILAPRHPKRAASVLALAKEKGLDLRPRSSLDDPVGADGLLVDTLGEMALFYSLAGLTFVGGSLIAKGGHTPFEPAQFGSMVLHGPHVATFADVYDRLDADEAALSVCDAETLRDALVSLDSPEKLSVFSAQATKTAKAMRDTLSDISPVLNELKRIRK